MPPNRLLPHERKNGPGMWLQCGAGTLAPRKGRLSVASSALRAGETAPVNLLRCGRIFLAAGELTAPAGPAYIHPHGAPSALRRDGAPSKLLTDQCEKASDGGRRLGASVVLQIGEHGTTVPGCLTSESEERETWTAESLRAAFRCGSIPDRIRPDETSAVDVSGQHPLRAARREAVVGTLVKRCDQPG
jgi:hypothetical protein